jgi:hypothetical protein
MQFEIVKRENNKYQIKVLPAPGGLWQTYGELYERGQREYFASWHVYETRSYWMAVLKCVTIYLRGEYE